MYLTVGVPGRKAVEKRKINFQPVLSVECREGGLGQGCTKPCTYRWLFQRILGWSSKNTREWKGDWIPASKKWRVKWDFSFSHHHSRVPRFHLISSFSSTFDDELDLGSYHLLGLWRKGCQKKTKKIVISFSTDAKVVMKESCVHLESLNQDKPRWQYFR